MYACILEVVVFEIKTKRQLITVPMPIETVCHRFIKIDIEACDVAVYQQQKSPPLQRANSQYRQMDFL